jgi:hypothetical protein
MPLFKTLSVMAIVSGIAVGLWAVGAPIAADNAHRVIPHAWELFIMRAGLCAGLISFGIHFYSFDPHRNKPVLRKPPAIQESRFYKAVGRE